MSNIKSVVLQSLSEQTIGKERGNFWTLDIETSDGLAGTILKVGAIFNPDNQLVISEEEDNRYFIFRDIKELKDYLFSKIPSENTKRKKGRHRNIFIHNLTFDIRFLLDYFIYTENISINHISAGSKDLAVELKFVKQNYTFRFIDSFQLTLCGQAILEETLLKKTIKRSDILVGRDMNLSFQDYIIRVKSDVQGLYMALNKYFKMIHDIFDIRVNTSKLISISSTSLKAFKRGKTFLPIEGVLNPYLKKEKLDGRYSEKIVIEPDILNLVYASYFGGRTEMFYKGYVENGNSYDANSLYPSVFHKDYPIISLKQNLNRWRVFTIDLGEKADLDVFKKKMDQFEGFLDCREKDGWIYEEETEIPILPTRGEDNRTMFTFGKKHGVFAFPELRYAIEKGVISIHGKVRLLLFTRGKFFGNYGEFCYNKRLIEKSKGSPLQLPLKIFMNSLYGKFGQKTKQLGIKMLSLDERKEFYCGKKPIEFLGKHDEVLHVIDHNDFTIIHYSSFSVSTFTLPHISSYVTSYARIELHMAMWENRDRLLYVDTDSIWITGDSKGIKNGNKLGEWKLEYKFSEAFFIGLKFYAYQLDSGLKIRIKGVTRQMLENAEFESVKDFGKRVIGYKFSEDAKYNTIKKSLKQSDSFLSASIRTKIQTGIYTKREILSNGFSKPIKEV